MIPLLAAVIGAQALSNQAMYAQELQEGDVSVSDGNDSNLENGVIEEEGVSIAGYLW